jgi:hypothetical protein
VKLYVVMHGGFLHYDGGDQPRAICTSRGAAQEIVSSPQVWFRGGETVHFCSPGDLYVVEVESDEWQEGDIRVAPHD